MSNKQFGMGLIVLVDQSASASMRGGSQSIKVFLSEFRALLSERLDALKINSHCKMAYVSHKVQWSPAVPINELNVETVKTSLEPGSNLGLALHETGTQLSGLMEAFLAQGQVYSLLRPIVLLLSDGWSTDDPDEGLKALKESYWGQQALLRAAVPPTMMTQRCERFLTAFAGSHVQSTADLDVLLREMLQSLHSESMKKDINQVHGGKI